MEISSNQNIILYSQTPSLKVDGFQNGVKRRSTPVFKSKWEGVLSKTGSVMQWIENGGFLILFLIQDFFGMTVPRTWAGFLRDKEVTGEYNIQEGFEVLGREGMTGPSMMAVAPISLWAASKFIGKSTSVNTELIKRYGNTLKEMVSSEIFNKSVLDNSSIFKHEFYKKNIKDILIQTLGEKYSNESINEHVNYIMKQLENYENIPKDVKLSKFMGKSKYRNECILNITNYINDLKYKTSSDLNTLQRIKFGSEKLKDIKVFDTKKAFEGLIKYTDDAIIANKKLNKLDSVMAESIKHKALGKRILINIGMIAATLSMLSVLPKIYAKSNVAPGSRQNNKNKSKTEEISFRGKHSQNITEKLGKIVEKNKKEFISSELEYNGHNFTNTLMACLSLFGLLTPRLKRAYDRAQTYDNGKKDYTELWEIIFRDVTSSLAVVFAVPMLTRACVTAYEKQSGFVLIQKDRTKSFTKTLSDLFNPYSKAHVLSNAEITALYDNINSKEKMVNFCKYIDKNGGDLRKILSKSDNINELFNETTQKLDKLKDLSRDKSNKEITEFMEKIEANLKKLGKSTDKKSIDDFITKLMKGASKCKNGKITALARGLNSVPGLLTTFFISPYILGWVIPRFTYKNTRRIHEKQYVERKKLM